MAQILPFCAILSLFIKKIYTSTGNLFVSITSPGRGLAHLRISSSQLSSPWRIVIFNSCSLVSLPL